MRPDSEGAAPPASLPFLARAIDRIVASVRGNDAASAASEIMESVYTHNTAAMLTPCCKGSYAPHYGGQTKRIFVSYHCTKCGRHYVMAPETRNVVQELDRKGINRFGSVYLWGLPPILRWFLLIGGIIGITIGLF